MDINVFEKKQRKKRRTEEKEGREETILESMRRKQYDDFLTCNVNICKMLEPFSFPNNLQTGNPLKHCNDSYSVTLWFNLWKNTGYSYEHVWDG